MKTSLKLAYIVLLTIRVVSFAQDTSPFYLVSLWQQFLSQSQWPYITIQNMNKTSDRFYAQHKGGFEFYKKI